MWTLLVLPGVLCVASLVFLAWVLRGRQTDRAPSCRDCGFALKGLYPPPKGIVGVCPRCESRIRDARDVRIGGRRINRPLAATAATLALLTAAGVLFQTLRTLAQPHTADIKPAWVLRMEMEQRGPLAATAAARELIDRLERGELSDDAARRAAQSALAAQADRTRRWLPEFGELVAAARGRGLLSDGEWARFVQNSFDFGVRARTLVPADRPILFQAEIAGVRLAPADRGDAGEGARPAVRVELVEASVAGNRIEVVQGEAFSVPVREGTARSGVFAAQASLPDGRHMVRTSWRVTPVGVGGGGGGEAGALERGEGDGSVVIDRFVSVDVMPPGVPMVRRVGWPEIDDSFVREIGGTDAAVWPLADGSLYAMGQLVLPRLPVDLSVDVLWRVRDASSPSGYSEFLIQQVMARAAADAERGGGGAMRERGAGGEVEPVVLVDERVTGEGAEAVIVQRYGGAFPAAAALRSARAVDVVLRTNVAPAERTLDVERVWDGEYVVRDVPLARGSRQPAQD